MRLLLVLSLSALAVPAIAQERGGSDMEASFRHQLQADPGDHVAMVNLARLYVKAGRPEKAQRLYRRLLAMDDVALERADGAPVRSHWLAAEAMKANAFKPVRVTSRER